MYHLKLIFIAICTLLLQGCAGVYFKEAGPAPEQPRFTLSESDSREYWTGIVFNGNKIGFSHTQIVQDPEKPGMFRINSEASLRFHFLSISKQVKLISQDWVNPDLTLNSFTYEYDLDGNRMKLYGAVRNNILDLIIESAAGRTTETYPLAAPLYPTSVVNLYPGFHGMQIGAEYQYDVYDGESQRISVVSQKVEGYEQSELFEGPAWKVNTRMHGQQVTTWINAKNEPVFELSLNGVFISALETETEAMQYLAQAALNKNETMLDYSLVRTDVPIATPRQLGQMEIDLVGLHGIELPEADARQQCAPVEGAVRCRINNVTVPAKPLEPEQQKRYLGSSIPIPHGHPVIADTLSIIPGLPAATTDSERIKLLLDWIGSNIEPEVVDVFSALEVLEQRKAECQGYSFLFASFTRALGIPTRVVNGLVYSEQHPGFLYHTWVESLIDGQWQAIDPTFGQLHADATHIKLVEGEFLADLTPLLNLLGKLSARIVQAKAE
jgi:hypothetical protein